MNLRLFTNLNTNPCWNIGKRLVGALSHWRLDFSDTEISKIPIHVVRSECHKWPRIRNYYQKNRQKYLLISHCINYDCNTIDIKLIYVISTFLINIVFNNNWLSYYIHIRVRYEHENKSFRIHCSSNWH
jgi:hypothetical protein